MTRLQLSIRPILISTLGLFIFGSCVAAPQKDADSDKPVTIHSNSASFDHNKGIAVYNGQVTVDQGSRHLTSDKLTIKRDENNRIKIMIATGKPARFKSQAAITKPIGYGKANLIKYYPQKDSVDLLGNAQLMQNGDTVSGPILQYNFTTGILQSKSTRKARSTVVLQPKRKS